MFKIKVKHKKQAMKQSTFIVLILLVFISHTGNNTFALDLKTIQTETRQQTEKEQKKLRKQREKEEKKQQKKQRKEEKKQQKKEEKELRKQKKKEEKEEKKQQKKLLDKDEHIQFTNEQEEIKENTIETETHQQDQKEIGTVAENKKDDHTQQDYKQDYSEEKIEDNKKNELIKQDQERTQTEEKTNQSQINKTNKKHEQKKSRPLTTKEKMWISLTVLSSLILWVTSYRYKRQCRHCNKWNAMRKRERNCTDKQQATIKETRFEKDGQGKVTSSKEVDVPATTYHYETRRKCKNCGFEDFLHSTKTRKN